LYKDSQLSEYKRSNLSYRGPVLLLFITFVFEFIDVFLWRNTLEKAVESMVSGRLLKFASRRTFSKCSGIDRIRLGWRLKHASIAKATGRALSTGPRHRHAIASFGPFLGPASPVSATAPLQGRLSERFPGSSAAAPVGVACIPGSKKNTWPTFVS
jgi:hypothetical protein